VHEKWIAFAPRLVAEWRQIVGGYVLFMMALVAHQQGWVVVSSVLLFVSGYLLTVALYDAVWPDDPDVVKEPSRRW